MGNDKEKETKNTKPYLRFVFTKHDHFPDNPRHLFQAIEGCDLLFIEAVSLSSVERTRKIEALFNLVLAKPETIDSESQKIQIEIRQGLLESENFVDLLVANLAGQGLHLVFVDISPADTCFPLLEESNKNKENLELMLRHGKIIEAQREHINYVASRAKFHTQREEVVQQQIETYLAALPKQIKIKAAIIQGLVHIPTASLFENDNFQIESVQLDELSLESELWLSKRLGQDISESAYQRALLADFILSAAMPENAKETTILVRRLTDDQISAAIGQFEVVYRQNLARLSNRRRLSQVEKEVYAPFAFNQTVAELLSAVKRWASA